MTERPLVTIVIPCYNYAHYLVEAIESALAQTYRPLEIIVVDDGSTDNTREVASRYPVRLISQPNQGLSVSTNNGVQAGAGEYVLRLDADDVLYQDFVAETVAALQQHPEVVLAHTGAEYFGTRAGRVPFVAFDPEALAQGAYATCTALIRRSTWDAVGGLDPRMPLCEDWDLWLTLAERGMPGVMVPRVLWGYRQHGPSMVTRRLASWSDLRREWRLIAALQDKHPDLFQPGRLARRLLVVPRRIQAGQMTRPHALRLLAFYGIMFVRVLLRACDYRLRRRLDNPHPGRSGSSSQSEYTR